MEFDDVLNFAPPSVRQLWTDWRAGRIDAMTLENRSKDLRANDPAARTFLDRLGAWQSAPGSRFDTIQ